MDEFQQALEAEFEDDATTVEDTTTENDETVEGDTTTTATTADEATESDEVTATDDAQQPKYATKSDVLSAIQEDRQHTTERLNAISNLRDKVIEQVQPDGVDRNLYDSNNQVIKTVQDIIDRGLIDPNTGEPFEYEAAAQWYMNAQKLQNKQIEELNKYADDAAEVYMSLQEGNDRIMDKYGDVLSVMPNVAKQLSEAYFATLQQDSNGIITKIKLDPVEFYDNALAPYLKMAQAQVDQQQKEAELAKQSKVNERDERMGIPPRGNNKSKSATGDKFLDAFMDEMEN